MTIFIFLDDLSLYLLQRTLDLGTNRLCGMNSSFRGFSQNEGRRLKQKAVSVCAFALNPSLLHVVDVKHWSMLLLDQWAWQLLNLPFSEKHLGISGKTLAHLFIKWSFISHLDTCTYAFLTTSLFLCVSVFIHSLTLCSVSRTYLLILSNTCSGFMFLIATNGHSWENQSCLLFL